MHWKRRFERKNKVHTKNDDLKLIPTSIVDRGIKEMLMEKGTKKEVDESEEKMIKMYLLLWKRNTEKHKKNKQKVQCEVSAYKKQGIKKYCKHDKEQKRKE